MPVTGGRDRVAALFVRAMLGQGRPEVPVRGAPAGVTRAFADALGFHLPATFPMYGAETPLFHSARLAAAAHLAAHVLFGAGRRPRGSLRPIQVVLVSLFEDARVERLTGAELPGLARLWRAFHSARPTDLATFPALCARLSRALADPDYRDPHPIVVKARALFFHPDHDLRNAEGSRRFGSLLGNDVGQMRLSFNARTYLVEPPYRDDHRLLWEEPPDAEAPGHEEAETLLGAAPRPDPRDEPPARAPDGEANPTGRARIGPAIDAAGPTPIPGVARYPEWDRRIRMVRPAWCTVRDQTAEIDAVTPAPDRAGAPEAIDRQTMVRLTGLARRLKVETLVTRWREREGDLLDLDAAVTAVVDRRCGASPDGRVYIRAARTRREVAVLVLLDLSASTNDPVRSGEGRVIDLERRATSLLGEVLARSGDRFAIHGFTSNGRHAVDYYRFKELADAWDDRTRGRLSSIVPRLSTRMGAALRHAGHCLRRVRRERRLVLLVTDGEPSDVDVFEPDYLVDDARHAVGELRRGGIHVLAVSLDAGADRYVRRIFGAGGYQVVDRLPHLPDVLPRLYARLVSR